jgi:hypothetical protein
MNNFPIKYDSLQINQMVLFLKMLSFLLQQDYLMSFDVSLISNSVVVIF